MKPSLLVGSMRRILHDANVHRLSNRYSNRLSCVVIDEARRTFKVDIARFLVDIEFAKRLHLVAPAALHPAGELIAPAPRQPYPPLPPSQLPLLPSATRPPPFRSPVHP